MYGLQKAGGSIEEYALADLYSCTHSGLSHFYVTITASTTGAHTDRKDCPL
jgi:hypothetical protein